MSARERRAKARKRSSAGRRLAAPAAFLTTAAIGLAGPALPAAHAGTYSVTQLRNINTAAAGSDPEDLTAVGGSLYYAGYTASNGRELWVTHGPGSGSTLVDDIDPGPASSVPTDLTNAGGELYFYAANANGAVQLWTSNGQTAGTVPLTGPLQSLYSDPPIVNVGTEAYFFQTNGDTTQLWSSNGTATGTVPTGLGPGGVNLAEAGSLTAVGSELYFTALGTTTGTTNDLELWETNGTTSGTQQLTSFDSGSVEHPDVAAELTNVAGTLYFDVQTPNGGQVWRASAAGAPAQVTTLPTNVGPSELTPVGSDLYFIVGNGGSGDQDLWQIAGTKASDLTTLANGPYTGAGELTNVDGTLFFTSETANGPLLSEYNGTLSQPLSGPNQADDLVNADGTLYFVAGTDHNTVWTATGTAGGTTEVSSGLSDIYGLVNAGSTVYFSAENSTSQAHLWSITGATVAEVDAAVSAGDDAGSYPTAFTNVNGNVFFDATQDGVTGLWLSNGTSGGTSQLDEVTAEEPVNVDGTLYFISDSASGDALWSSNGTSAGTAPLTLNGVEVYPGYLANGNGELYFSAYGTASGTTSDPELWVTNGTSLGTHELTSFNDAAFADSRPLANVGSEVYFAIDTPNGNELWATNGSAAGTHAVTDAATPSTAFSEVSNLTAGSAELYFVADLGSSSELWVTNGTTSGTVELDSSATSTISLPVSVDANVFFSVQNGLWASNGTAAGTTELAQNVDPSELVNVSGELFFADEDTGSVWKSDGTAAGTQPVDTPGAGGVGDLVNASGVLAFSANDGTHGTELWTSNGSASGTAMVSDIWPGAASGLYPSLGGGYYDYQPQLTDAGANLFFAADNGVDGVEPYVASSFGAGSASGSGGGTSTTPTTTTPTTTTPTTTTTTPKPTPIPIVHPPHPILGGSSGSGHTIELKLACPTGDATCVVKGTLEIVETFTRGKLTAISAEATAGKRKQKVKTVKQTIKLSSGTLTLAAGHSGTLKLTLDGAGARLLSRRHKLTTELLVTDGTDIVAKRSVTFRAPVVKPKQHKQK